MPDPKPAPAVGEVKYATYSSRDYINKIYVDKFGDCAGLMVQAIDRSSEGFDNAEKEFKKMLAALYILVVTPRRDKIPSEFKAILGNKKMPNRFLELTMDEAEEIYATIGLYLYDFGVLRSESKNPDLKHILISKLEPRRPHHGGI